MRRRTKVTVVLVLGFALFAILAPVVPFSRPAGTFMCPKNGCRWPVYGSVTYWAFGVGGVVTAIYPYARWDNYTDYHYTLASCQYCYS